MAKIWPVYAGKEPTIGGPWARLEVEEAVALFELQPEDRVSDLSETPRFGDVHRDLTYAGFKYIVVEIESREGRTVNLKPGFYKSKISPKAAFKALVRQAVASELGAENVEDVIIDPTTDSQGQQALKVTVVIPPGASDRLEGSPVLDALVKVRQRFVEMRESRIPIIEYATKAELRQDASL